ncbi:hypothetical protein EDB89DRAFT_1952151 [Lactarius sanguifluus]|nr:hypothetical protein EDB89DRAFT_1952151 [Lactarius sanguifluus]
MAYFDASFSIANPHTSPPLGAPASVEDGSTTQSGHLDRINSIFDCPEGDFICDGDTLPLNTTGFEHLLGGFTTTTNATPSASTTAPPPFTDYGAYTYGFDLLSFHRAGTFLSFPRHVCLRIALPRFVLTKSKALTNASSIPSPPGDGIGGHINTPHTDEALAWFFHLQVSSSGLLWDFGITDIFQAEQVSQPPWLQWKCPRTCRMFALSP